MKDRKKWKGIPLVTSSADAGWVSQSARNIYQRSGGLQDVLKIWWTSAVLSVILVWSGLCHFCRFWRAVRVVEGNNHPMCYSCHMQVPSLRLLSPLSLEFRSFACHLKGEKLGQFIWFGWSWIWKGSSLTSDCRSLSDRFQSWLRYVERALSCCD
jgi:hypothetical protein